MGYLHNLTIIIVYYHHNSIFNPLNTLIKLFIYYY